MNTGVIKTALKSAQKASVSTVMKLRKASPEIMLVGGVVAGAAAIITACFATKKVTESKISEKASQELDEVQMDADEGTIDSKTKRKESFKIYRKMVWEYAKVFGPSAILFFISMGLFLGSHGILKKRYVSTTLAYKALDEAFKDYRKRVQDAVGEERELHYFNGTHEGGEDTIIDENGEAHTTKISVKDTKKNYSPYEFDWNARTAPGNWEANSDYNMMFLNGIQNYANDLLNSRGHVFMNEVLDGLGLKRTREGAVVGWLKGCGGDDFVDFGLSEYYTDEYSDAHQDGYLKNIHLNFNVDGLIWDKI